MRAVFWLIILFVLAAALAWLAGNNQGMVTLFLHPHRIDISLNLAFLLLLTLVVLAVLTLRALEAFLALPKKAQAWRLQQKERASHAALLEAIGYFISGRFLRARKAAMQTLSKEALLSGAGVSLEHAVSLRAMAHIMVAESSHALQDKALRDQHWRLAMEKVQASHGLGRETWLEGAQLRQARWLLDDRDAQASLQRLQELPPAVGRRMVAMRLHLKAARLAGQPAQALETAVLLAKHRAFSPVAAESLVARLIQELIAQTNDLETLQRVWSRLTPPHRLLPEVAAEAVLRSLQLGGSTVMGRLWLQDLWDSLQSPSTDWSSHQLLRVVVAFDACMPNPDETDAFVWLSRVENAQQSQPRAAHLQYLAGMLCKRHSLWGKAQSLLVLAVKNLKAPALQRAAWMALAELAEQRQETREASLAWKSAAKIPMD